jgi:cell division protein FtsB
MMQFGDDTQTHDLARENERLRAEIERLNKEGSNLAAIIRQQGFENEQLRLVGIAQHAELAKALLEIDGLFDKLVLAVKQIDAVTAENERLRLRVKFLEDEFKCPSALEPKPDLRALLPELAVIRQVMKDTKP